MQLPNKNPGTAAFQPTCDGGATTRDRKASVAFPMAASDPVARRPAGVARQAAAAEPPD